MRKYQIRFFFNAGGPCAWSGNKTTKLKFGNYPIEIENLPISNRLKQELSELDIEYGTYLDWREPNAPTLWTKEHMIDFMNRATIAYEKLKNELGDEYEVINRLQGCVDLNEATH